MYAKQTTRSRREHTPSPGLGMPRPLRQDHGQVRQSPSGCNWQKKCMHNNDDSHVRVAPEKDIGETIHKRDQHASTIHCIIGTASGAEHP